MGVCIKVLNKNMKYRSRTDIVAEILEAVNSEGNEGCAKTKIMYKAYLSYAQLQEYIEALIQNNLLEQTAEKHYKVTQRGIDFAKTYKQMGEFILQ